jgi:hypothetical protein
MTPNDRADVAIRIIDDGNHAELALVVVERVERRISSHTEHRRSRERARM